MIHFSADRFNDWLGFLRGLPCWTPDFYHHIKLIVSTLRPEQLSGEGKYISKFIETLIVNEFNLKKEQRLQICQMFINDIVTQETDSDKYDRLQEILIA